MGRLNLFLTTLQSLEARFTSIDRKFSQVISSSASDVTFTRDNVSQDVLNHSVSAPTSVAVRSENAPDRAPSASYTGNLGTTQGGPAAASSPTGGSSLPRLSFKDLLVTVRFFESSGGSVPDIFIKSLCNVAMYFTEHSFAMGGASLADSIISFCTRLSNPVDPAPKPFLSGDSMIAFLCRLVGVSSLSSPFAVGADGVRSVEGSVSLGSRFVPPPPGFVRLSGISSFGSLLPPSSASASVPSVASSVASLLPFLLEAFRLLWSPSCFLPSSRWLLLSLLLLLLSSLSLPLALPSFLLVSLWLLLFVLFLLLALVLLFLQWLHRLPLRLFQFLLFCPLLFLHHLLLLPSSLVLCRLSSPIFMLLSLPLSFLSSVLALRELFSLGLCHQSSLVLLPLWLLCLLLFILWFLLWFLWVLLFFLLFFLLSLLSILCTLLQPLCLLPLVSPGILGHPPCISAGPGFSLASGGLCLAVPRVALDVDPGVSGASCSYADPIRFRDGDDASDRGDKESAALGKVDFSKAFHDGVLDYGFLSHRQAF